MKVFGDRIVNTKCSDCGTTRLCRAVSSRRLVFICAACLTFAAQQIGYAERGAQVVREVIHAAAKKKK